MKNSPMAEEYCSKHSTSIGIMGAAVIVGLTVLAYAQVSGFEFVNYDDNSYVYENTIVQQGLSVDGVVWAITTGTLSNWHPVTWLSYMLDVQLFGASPGAMHTVNLVFHILNSVLVLLLFWRLAGAVLPAMLAAALFALHPLHVESVAWISERKDVLSTFFGLLALAAYAWYAAQPSLRRNLLVALVLALGLMAKPMLVTWPFVFLLLDYWPLRRPWRPSLLLEKWPHFLLVAGSSVATYLAQQAGGAVRTIEAVSLAVRVQNALMAYGIYLRKTFWPTDLGVFYPYPKASYPTAWIIATAVIVLAVTVAVLLLRRPRPYLLVGWLWFLGTLIPVIGIVQVGDQAYADRYTYVPLIGIFVAIAWFVYDLTNARKGLRIAYGAAGLALACLLTFATHVQAGYWRDNVSLYEHTLAVTSDNPTIHYNLGTALLAEGRDAEAQEHLAEANALWPDNPNGLTNLAISIMEQGDYARAEELLKELLAKNPDHLEARINLAVVALRQERWEDAIYLLNQVLRIDPENAESQLNLGLALAALERWEEAEPVLGRAASKLPSVFSAQFHWGRSLAKLGGHAEAAEAFNQALKVNAESVAAWYQLGNSYLALGKYSEAQNAFEHVLVLEPNHGAAELNLGIVLASQNDLSGAIEHLRRSLEIRADNADAHFNLALALHLSGQNDEAKTHVEEALRLNSGDANAQQLLGQIGQ